ncbi:MAG: hypothetical protein HGB08_03570 [Candidatus Moranbacteria bacterium]|nr:hypothetical protein [Candidatus Moranbacteria bacterium]
MKKGIIYVLYALIVLIALAGAVMGWNHYRLEKARNASPAVDNAKIILFYGSTCPHCKVVEDYLANNDVRNKISFSEKEVYGSQADARLMMDRQTACGIGKDEIGAVPFLWTKDKCYFGQEEIIQFFKDQLSGSAEGVSNSQ